MPCSVAVIIPAYNAAAYLGEALESVHAQSRQPDEVWVVDDASADETASVAEGGGARVLRLATNGGPGNARNAAMRLARTDLVAFLDADDWWLPQHLASVTGALDAAPSAILSSTQSQLSRVWPAGAAAVLPERVPFEPLTSLARSNFVIQSAACARREAVLAAGGYDTSCYMVDDYELWLRLAMRGLFVFMPAITVMRRLHPQQMSHDGEELRALTWQVRAELPEKMRQRGVPPAMIAAVLDALRIAAAGERRDILRHGDVAELDHLLHLITGIPELRGLAATWRRLRALWPAWYLLRDVGRRTRSLVRG